MWWGWAKVCDWHSNRRHPRWTHHLAGFFTRLKSVLRKEIMPHAASKTAPPSYRVVSYTKKCKNLKLLFKCTYNKCLFLFSSYFSIENDESSGYIHLYLEFLPSRCIVKISQFVEQIHEEKYGSVSNLSLCHQPTVVSGWSWLSNWHGVLCCIYLHL